MSRTLVIDSATEACSVALFEDAELVAGEWRLLGRGHAEQLVPMIATLPARGRAERVAVDIGPGSFTGIRVGLAAAKALALAWNARIVGYGALALVCAMARARTGADVVAAAMTGGHGEWFVGGDRVVSLPPEQAAQAVTAALVAGSQAEALVARRGYGEAVSLLPDARHFDLLGLDELFADPRPVYGRGPDARLPAMAGA